MLVRAGHLVQVAAFLKPARQSFPARCTRLFCEWSAESLVGGIDSLFDPVSHSGLVVSPGELVANTFLSAMFLNPHGAGMQLAFELCLLRLGQW